MRPRLAAYTIGILASLATIFAVLFLDTGSSGETNNLEPQSVQTSGSHSPVILGTQGDVNITGGSD